MLDEGCIELMHSGQTAGQVQIIDIKPIKNPQGGAAGCHLLISDGRHYMQARHPAGAARRGARRRPAASKPHPNRPRFPPFARPPEAVRASRRADPATRPAQAVLSTWLT